jgi:hypothetical protein
MVLVGLSFLMSFSPCDAMGFARAIWVKFFSALETGLVIRPLKATAITIVASSKLRI